MADNAPLPPASGSTRNAATDQVTYSGDTADVQLVRVVDVTGVEGGKTVVSPYALVSTANSSTANIAAAGTFIGAAEDVSEYAHISVAIFASHANAADGLQIQQSTDGTNWDFGDSFSIPAATGKVFSVPVQARFFRISYTNGATLTTAFRLQVIFSKRQKKSSSIKFVDARSVDNDFEEMVAYNAGFNGTSWDRLRSSIANGLAVDVTRLPSVALASVGGTNVNASPVGFQRVTDEPRALFYDPFEALDTTDRWTPTTAGGGVAPAVAGGRLTLGSGTTNNGYAYATSQPVFIPAVPGWLGFSFVIKLESAVGINAVRFWGMGLVSGSVPSSTNPLGTTGNGLGFEVDIAGVLRAVMYSNGVRTVINALASNQPADANDHRYIIAYRTDRTDFYIDGLGSAQLVATASFQSPQVQTLSLLLLAVAHTPFPAASRVIDCAGLAVWDTAKGNTTISDGLLPHRKVTIKKPSTAAAATDLPMVVALHPSSQLPSGGVLPAAAAMGDAFANPTASQIAAASLLFNGSTWDRERGMSLATTTGDSGTKIISGNGATITNVGSKGLQVVIVLGAATGIGQAAVFKLQSSVDGGSNWVDVPGAATASLSASGSYGISVYPGQAVTAGVATSGTTATASGVITRSWRVVWTIGGTTPSFTITSVTYNYLPN